MNCNFEGKVDPIRKATLTVSVLDFHHLKQQ
jgi:hypothetical protein